jgi:signal transduction histidine kinase
MRRLNRHAIGYAGILCGCLAAALLAGFTPFATQIDNDAYDWMFRLRPQEPVTPHSALLVVDDESLRHIGGMRWLRPALAQALERLAAARPAVVAVDITLADRGDPAENARLAAALGRLPNLVLACDLDTGGGAWQEPVEEFARLAKAVGHVHSEPDRNDAVIRQVPLIRVGGSHQRRWALSFEAFRLWRGSGEVVESPGDVTAGGITIPARFSEGRPLRIRFLRGARIPSVPLKRLLTSAQLPGEFSGRAVFVGITSQSAAQDRHMTPYSYGVPMPGVEIHAHAFETLAGGRFLTDLSDSAVLAICLVLAAAAGAIFWFLSGWPAYLAGAALLAVVHLVPYALFLSDLVSPYFAPAATAWLSVAAAASYQHFAVRGTLRRTEVEKTRYQQAIRFVTHEMRTPLTAIQGSSELMSRYNLSEEKRKQIAQMINSESKRLARMIQTFLDVERLSEGQMELKRERFAAQEVVASCVGRVRPLAERKNIAVHLEEFPHAALTGDRELMEYAVYNLLTNAIKYSPAGTNVRVGGRFDSGALRLAVADEGMGMDEKELRSIFKKFYRTRKAEASGEAGTGIGLSIVDQIVTHHGGRIEVTSQPGRGSCFTLVLPAESYVPTAPQGTHG